MTVLILAAAVLGGFAALIYHRYFSLKDFDPVPGPWFDEYMEDWRVAHNIPKNEIRARQSSGIVKGRNGTFIYATDTPEWDRGWFESRGYHFPARWVTFESLRYYDGPAGQVVELDL